MTIPRAVFVLPFIIVGCTSPQQRDAEEQQRYNRANESWQSRQTSRPGVHGVKNASLVANADGAVRQKSSLLNVDVDASKVIFVVDASGSMLDKMGRVTSEVAKAIRQMPAGMRFNIVMLSEDSWESVRDGYIATDEAGKKQAADYLSDVSAHGSSDPIPGLRAVFAAAPDVVFLMTDGDFPNDNQVLETIRKLNPKHTVTINTVAVVDSGYEYELLLKTIADENNGKFLTLK